MSIVRTFSDLEMLIMMRIFLEERFYVKDVSTNLILFEGIELSQCR